MTLNPFAMDLSQAPANSAQAAERGIQAVARAETPVRNLSPGVVILGAPGLKVCDGPLQSHIGHLDIYGVPR